MAAQSCLYRQVDRGQPILTPYYTEITFISQGIHMQFWNLSSHIIQVKYRQRPSRRKTSDALFLHSDRKCVLIGWLLRTYSYLFMRMSKQKIIITSVTVSCKRRNDKVFSIYTYRPWYLYYLLMCSTSLLCAVWSNVINCIFHYNRSFRIWKGQTLLLRKRQG